MNAIIPITRKTKGPGYVYLIKLSMFKNAYKIGSTTYLYRRRAVLECIFGSARYVSYGYVYDRVRCERIIQSILENNSNVGLMSDLIAKGTPLFCPDMCKEFIGGVTSKEHFKFKDQEIPEVMLVFNAVCASIKYPPKRGDLV